MNWHQESRGMFRTGIFAIVSRAPNGKTLEVLRGLPGCGDAYGTLTDFRAELSAMVTEGLIYCDPLNNAYRARVTSDQYCRMTGELPQNLG